MSKKALLALCVVVLIPVLFYMIVSHYGVVNMPPRYYPDSVITVMKDGKAVTDTAWRKVKNIVLQNQLGDTISLDQLKGKVIVTDFFFTHCASICPILMRNIKRLQDGLKLKDDMKRIDTTFVQFLSFSVDPTRDSVPVIKRYADRYGVNSDVWWLLTGPKRTIYDFALHELRLDLRDSVSVDSNFVHTDYVTLIDKDRIIRGYYHGTDTAALTKLADDIVFIMLERDKHKQSIFAGQKPLLVTIVVVLLLTAGGTWYFSRRTSRENLT